MFQKFIKEMEIKEYKGNVSEKTNNKGFKLLNFHYLSDPECLLGCSCKRAECQ